MFTCEEKGPGDLGKPEIKMSRAVTDCCSAQGGGRVDLEQDWLRLTEVEM